MKAIKDLMRKVIAFLIFQVKSRQLRIILHFLWLKLL